LNRYAYTLDNPVNHTDPTGHCAQASYKNKIVSDDQCEAQPGSDVPLTDKGKGKNEKCTRGDCDGLRMYKLYLYYLSHPGFWNNSNAANGFTPQQLDSYIKLIDLRSRWYDPATGRFQTKDSWQGDYNSPQSLNQWNYGLDNPINNTDPSGNISCEDSNDAVCMAQAQKLKSYGLGIQEDVRQGSLPPVEGLAEYADYAMPLFDNDMRGAMWALTITIDGMDANKGMVWPQVNSQNQDYWLRGFKSQVQL